MKHLARLGVAFAAIWGGTALGDHHTGSGDWSAPLSEPPTAAAALVAASVACSAVPETGREIADAMPGLHMKHPDILARLVGGQFDSMTAQDKVATLLEIWRRGMIARGIEVAHANAIVDSSKQLYREHPDPRLSIERAVGRALASYRSNVQADVAADVEEPPQMEEWWYAYADRRCTQHMHAIREGIGVDACWVCKSTSSGGRRPVAVMRVSVMGIGTCYVCDNCPPD